MSGTRALWGLPPSPQRLIKWLEMNVLPVVRWATAVGARRECVDCGAGIIDLLRFADAIGEYYDMSKRERNKMLNEMILLVTDSGLEVGVWRIPLQCTSCERGSAGQAESEGQRDEWVANWLKCFEVGEVSDPHNLSLAKRVPGLMNGPLVPDDDAD